MGKYKLIYGEGISEIIEADSLKEACDGSSYPDADIIDTEVIQEEISHEEDIQ